MRFDSTYLRTASLLLLGACGFFKDNQAPSLVYKADNSSSNSTACLSLDDISSPVHLDTYLTCQRDSLHDKFKKIRSEKANALLAPELTALINEYYAKEHPKKVSQVRGLLALKQLIAGGDADSLRLDEVDSLIERLRPHLPLIYGEWKIENYTLSNHRNELVALLRSLTAPINADTKITRDDLAGVAGFFDLPDAAPAARFFTNEHNAGLLAELLALLAGQSEGDTSYLPGSLFRAAPDIVNDAYEYREASDNEELYSATDIPTPLAQRTQKVNEISQRLLTHVLEASKYRDGGFSQGDLTRFLTRLKEQPPVWRDKALELRFEPNSLARRIFRFKNAFLGSGEQLFGKQTLGSLRTYLVNLSIDSPILYHEWDARKAIPESIRTLPSAGNNLWTFFDQFKGPIIGYDGPAYLYGQPKDQGTVYLSKVISLYRNLQVTSAAIQSFDDNGNYALDLVNGQVDDEFRRLIKFFSVFDNISQQFAPAEKDADRSNGKKQDSPKSATDIADDAVAHEGRLDQMLNHPLLGSGLVFIVDNFGVFGNGDGALNGAELRELVDFVDEVASAPEHFDRTRKYFAQYYCSNEAYEHILSKDPPRGWTPTCLDYVGYDGGYTLINKIPLFSAAQVQFSTTEWAVFFGEHLSPDYLKPQARATYDQYGNQLAAAFEILREFKFGQSDMGMRYALPAAFAKLTGTILTNTSPLKRPSKITYEQVQKFLGSRLGPGSLSWLDAKFQLLLLMAPPQLTSELVVRMLWNAPQVRDFALHRSAGDGDWKKQLVNLLSKLESPKPNAAISPEELSLRALQLASALNLLLPADQPTTH